MSSGQVAGSVKIDESHYEKGKIVKIARGEIGTTEYSPTNKRKYSERVAEYFAANNVKVTPGQNPLNYPWCALFIGWVLKQANYVGTKSAAARSYLNWGTPIYDKKLGIGSIEDAQVDDIVVNYRGSRDDGTTGHVFFYLRHDKQYIYGVGGNQGDSVSEAKFPRSRCIGIRRPRYVPLVSKTNLSAAGSASTGIASKAIDHIDKITPDNIDAAKTAVDQALTLGDILPYLGAILAFASVALAILAIYWRTRDYHDSGL